MNKHTHTHKFRHSFLQIYKVLMVLYITVTVKLSTCAQAGFPLPSVAINIYEDIALVYYSQIKPQVMKRAYSVVTYSIVKSTDIWTMTTFFYFFLQQG